MVRVRCHGKWVVRKLHYTDNGRPYVMERKKGGGGVKRKYLKNKKRKKR